METTDLVERQARAWQEACRIEEGASGPGVAARQAPVIAITREFGALGTEVGRMAAHRLAFDYFDRELVDLIATAARVRAKRVELVDERIRDRFSNWLTEQFGGDDVSHAEYMAGLKHVFRGLGRRGRAVIVGRGGHFLLDPARTLRVRVFAPLAVRVERVAAIGRTSLDEAADQVRRADEERRRFSLASFGQDPADPRHSDLLLDSGSIPLDACAGIVVAAFHAKLGLETGA
jgi:hypothetical protein